MGIHSEDWKARKLARRRERKANNPGKYKHKPRKRVFTKEQLDRRKVAHCALMAKYRAEQPEKIKAIQEKRKQRLKTDPAFPRETLDKFRVYRKNKKQQRRDLLLEMKKLGCSICGYNKLPEILEFHHTNPKEKDLGISVMINKSCALEKIKKEIAKCVILCPNCHREIHICHTN